MLEYSAIRVHSFFFFFRDFSVFDQGTNILFVLAKGNHSVKIHVYASGGSFFENLFSRTTSDAVEKLNPDDFTYVAFGPERHGPYCLDYVYYDGKTDRFMDPYPYWED
jgi:hypothetical protein